MTLRSLTPPEVNELITQSEGRAVSYIDSPEWYCGERRSTHMALDGLTVSAPGECGTCHSLAYAIRERCVDYLTNMRYAEESAKRVETIEAELIAEESRKRPSKRRIETLAREQSIARQDWKGCLARAEAIRVKYFRGYESRLLVGAL